MQMQPEGNQARAGQAEVPRGCQANRLQLARVEQGQQTKLNLLHSHEKV